MSLTVQYVVIALVVAASLVYMVRKLAPQAWRRWQGACAAALANPSHAAPVRALGRFLQPRQTEAAGCDSGCTTCNGCGTDSSEPLREQPLTFHPRQR